MMDDMRHESRIEDRNGMIQTIMDCEGVSRDEAELLLIAAEHEDAVNDAANDFRAVER
ncbi:hypothetical protein [Burkholderia gladioli]|uniref:hypothetical protein n=1 Tax=Burkholderia gladioli TaxID=28095 RepID=UPI001640E5B2|nr:hypothetical protein [Burkholderia gladioli]